MSLEVELEYETEVEAVCPKCGHKHTIKVTGTTSGEIEPPDRDGPDM